MLGIILRALVFGLLVYGSLAACPHSCSGHGSCGTENVCSCDWGWDIAPDCSLRKCPNATSWGVKPHLQSVGHMATECAGVGVCDYVSGLCTCPLGFTGQACERLACPKDCNGRGTCQTVRNAGFTYGRDLSVAYSSGDGKGPLYNNWDHSSTTMCVCDIGFTGPDCSTSKFCWTLEVLALPLARGLSPMVTCGSYLRLVALFFRIVQP